MGWGGPFARRRWGSGCRHGLWAHALSVGTVLMVVSRPPLLVVLDLDETLVHSPDGGPLERPADFFAGSYPVYRRPGVEAFLHTLLDELEVAVWTSSSELYASLVTRELFGPRVSELQFIWAARRCTQRFDPEWQEKYWLKNLGKVKRLGRSLERVVAVDDTPRKYSRHYGNLVRVKPWTGDLDDDELPALLEYLRWLSTQDNVRAVDKRGWRQRAVLVNETQSSTTEGA